MPKSSPLFIAMLFHLVVGLSLVRGESIWREGEHADQSDVQIHDWYNSVRSELLSGGEWLSNFGSETGTASYHLQVPRSGQYVLWLRANPTGAKLSWRWGDEEWKEAPMKRAEHRVNVAEDEAIDIRFVAWLKLAELDLQQGQQTLQIKFHSKNNNHGAIDAIFLTDEGLAPVGKGNPKEEGQKHADGFFAWSPGLDPLNGKSPIDLRYLNEATAGANGFVRREGDQFVLGDGQPVRFWMVQDGMGSDPSQYERRARRIAKYGVNLVRMGGGQFFKQWREDRTAFQRSLDDFHRKVAALKKAGIYTYIDHLYWHTHHEIDESVFPGFGDGKHAIALIFFSERFQDLYLDFLQDMLTIQNPYTGMPMADDPAVAMVEIHNESGLLFYTFKPSAFPESECELVERSFGNWLQRKYGSLKEAVAAWGEKPRSGNPTADALEDGRVGLYDAGVLSGADWAVRQRNQARAGDQLQFLVESQKAFYEKMTAHLRHAVGAGQVIAPSNWKSADPRVLDGLERYTYTGADVICRNSYFDVDYKEGGQQRFYRIEVGDTYRYHSAIKTPGRPSPLGTPLIANYPFLVTENNWTRPNRYRVEWPLMVATYSRMMGVDGWTFFAKEDTDWRHSMGVWDVSNPSVLGQFPAAALMFRRGDVTQPSQPAVEENVSLKEAFDLNGTAAVPLRGEDPLWKTRLNKQQQGGESPSEVNPLAYFVGPVIQRFGDGPSHVESVDLSKYIDAEKQTVRSLTGELFWDAGRGVMTVDTPRAQGAWGFLKSAGPIQLADIAIESKNEYGAVLAVSLDGKPLMESEKILIQTGTWDRPYGFETQPIGEYQRITKLGGYPLNVKNVESTISLNRPIDSATVLDANGYLTDRGAEIAREESWSKIRLPSDSLYTLLK